MSKEGNLGSKVKWLFQEIKTHWNTPAPGKYVPYKEYKDVIISVGSNYAGSKTLEYIAFAASCYLMMYHYKLPYLTFSIINIINMPLGYIWTLIWWFVCDNLGFLPKKTERKLNLLYICMTLLGLAMIIFDPSKLFDQSGSFVTYMNSLEGISCASAFKILGTHIFYNGYVGLRNIFWRKKLIPKFGRYKYSLYCDAVPKCIMVILIGWLPFYNIPDVVTRVWVANLLFAVYNMFGFGSQMEAAATNISPNVRERILVRAYPIKISHILNSILAIILPVFIGMLRYKWADINMFRYVIPITFVASVILTMIFAGRVKERIPQPPLEKKVQIDFWDGMFGVMSNKYKWINTVYGLLDSLGNGMLGITTILYLYTFRLSGLIYSLIVALVSFAGTPPDLLSPYFMSFNSRPREGGRLAGDALLQREADAVRYDLRCCADSHGDLQNRSGHGAARYGRADQRLSDVFVRRTAGKLFGCVRLVHGSDRVICQSDYPAAASEIWLQQQLGRFVPGFHPCEDHRHSAHHRHRRLLPDGDSLFLLGLHGRQAVQGYGSAAPP